MGRRRQRARAVTAEVPGRTRIKVTGVVQPDDAVAAVEAGADMVACVFYAASPRWVTTQQVWDIRRAIGARAALVGVFVDTPTPLVQRLVDHCRLDYAQLFGGEPVSAVEALRPRAFKAVTVADAEAIGHARREHLGRRGGEDGGPDLLLHVTGDADGPWSALPEVTAAAQVIVAGSYLTAATVGSVVRAARPWAVDVWEAIESAPGEIDHDRLRAFVAAVRQADSACDADGR